LVAKLFVTEDTTMPKSRKIRKAKAPAKFRVGDRVRVRPGVLHHEHPDIPLGGWAGSIARIHRDNYLARWSEDTLAATHPICRRRSAIEGTDLQECWLGEDELEPDSGGPLGMEQPTQITPRPLSAKNQGDRVRMVFGLTSDEFLPDIDEDSLETYYDYLDEQVSLPTEAMFCDAHGVFSSRNVQRELRTVKIVALDRKIGWEKDVGILLTIRAGDEEEIVPLVELAIRRSDPNFQIFDDFSAWFFGDLCADCDNDEDDENFKDDSRYDEEDRRVSAEEDPEPTQMSNDGSSLASELEDCIAFVLLWAVVGAAVVSMPWARWAAGIGGVLLGLFMAFGSKSPPRPQCSRVDRIFHWTAILVGGGLFGALFGTMAVAIVGSLLGAVAGWLLKRIVAYFRGLESPLLSEIVLYSAACGVVAQAFYFDRAAAIAGLWQGALAAVGCILLVFSVLFVLHRIGRRNGPQAVFWRIGSK
jgi:hypothetical protein